MVDSTVTLKGIKEAIIIKETSTIKEANIIKETSIIKEIIVIKEIKISKACDANAIKSITTNPLPKQAYVKPSYAPKIPINSAKLILIKIFRQSTITIRNLINSFKICLIQTVYITY